MPTKRNRRFIEQVEKLVAQPRTSFLKMESNCFDELAGPFSSSLVLFGAGGLGRKTLAGLRTLGMEPHAFADNDPSKNGRLVDGVRVLSPEHAAQEFGKAAIFIITVYADSAPGRLHSIKEKLARLGCKRVVPFAPLYWKYPSLFLPEYAVDLPHKVVDAADEIKTAAALFEDKISQTEYLGQIHWRLNPESAPIAPQATHEIYFPPDLIVISKDEVFIDCGAYTGDTVRSFLQHSNGQFERLLAFEPDPANYRKLRELVDSLPPDIASRVSIKDVALGDRTEQLRFNAGGIASSSLSKSGGIVIQSAPLDSLLADLSPTWIKMDIEGAEMAALEGSIRSIQNHRPILAISVYHRQDHIWRIPSLLHALSDEYTFYLRRYTPLVLDDLVLYAIPAHRKL